MNFYKRLIFFSSGFILGLVLLSFFLIGKKTSCSYFPSDRVIKNVNSKKIIYNNLNDSLLVKKILFNGKVNFSKSDTKLDSCKSYHIENKVSGIEYTILIENCDEYILVEEIKKVN
tara:strand:- start:16 stop:363 length:348 start_codon:yes stop_codon:yes gene_type:complete